MNKLLQEILSAAGISGYEGEIAKIMKRELTRSCDTAEIDPFGNVIARKGKGKTKIMLAAHMDEIGLLVKYISKEGFVYFLKIGGIDDRILPGQRVIVKSKKGDVFGVIGTKPPHLQKDEERKKPLKYEDMFIDVGASSRDDAERRISTGDAIIFEPNSGVLSGKLCYGKAVDDRIGCYAILKAMEKIDVNAEVYAVATAQEEVGLKGARTSSFKIDPDFAIAVDTTIAGDTPGIQEKESSLKLGSGVAITLIEASGRGIIVNEKVKDLFIETAKKEKIKFQIAVIDGGMTDGAMIYMNRVGIPTGVLSIPTRYIHAPTSVFSTDDIDAAVSLLVHVVKQYTRSRA